MNILAVIPARGGSKGIPRKNMRLMYGKPLIAYAIENAIACDQISHVVVSSDSEEILAFARQYDDVLVVNRDSVLARDAVTLDPVIFDATDRAEKHWGLRFDAVVTLQPTSYSRDLEHRYVRFRVFRTRHHDKRHQFATSELD